MPRTSVLIPTFNRADYLPQAVAGVQAQTIQDIEIVIVDDGSTDNTREIVSAHNDARVRYIYQENRGVGAALNTAWRAAQSDYVAFLGSDDVMLSHQIETLLPLIERDAAVGVIYARAQGMNAQGEPLPQLLGTSLKFPDRALASLLYGDCVCTIACIVRRECLERVGGFDESLIANEDWEMWIRLAEITRFAYREQVLAHYRMHPTSLTGGRSDKYQRVVLDRVRLIENYYARTNLPQQALDVQPLAFRNVYMDAGIRLLAIGKRRAALAYFWRAIRAHGNPIRAAARVFAVAMFDLYLSKTYWGVRLVDSLVARRRRLTA